MADFTSLTASLQWSRMNNLPDVYMLALQAQAMLETGKFTSNLYQNYNNAFGMRAAVKRAQNRTGIYNSPNNGDFAIYAGVQQSFEDRVHLDRFNNVNLPYQIIHLTRYCKQVLANGYVPLHERESYYAAWWVYIRELVSAYQGDLITPEHSVNDEHLYLTGTENELYQENLGGGSFFGGIIDKIQGIFDPPRLIAAGTFTLILVGALVVIFRKKILKFF